MSMFPPRDTRASVLSFTEDEPFETVKFPSVFVSSSATQQELIWQITRHTGEWVAEVRNGRPVHVSLVAEISVYRLYRILLWPAKGGAKEHIFQ